jgi:isopenicillin N synthase-like dioxygenase
VLAQDPHGGLQVMGGHGQWVPAEPRASTFVVNIGDMMAKWSGGRYKSTLHRVVQPMGGSDRYSLPFFFNPSLSTQINRPEQQLHGAEPVTAYGHLQARYADSGLL